MSEMYSERLDGVQWMATKADREAAPCEAKPCEAYEAPPCDASTPRRMVVSSLELSREPFATMA